MQDPRFVTELDADDPTTAGGEARGLELVERRPALERHGQDGRDAEALEVPRAVGELLEREDRQT
jgi:hypothetical protein